MKHSESYREKARLNYRKMMNDPVRKKLYLERKRLCLRKIRTKTRWQRIKSKYKMTRVEYERMFESQGGKCKICLCNLTGDTIFNKPNVDHDHKSLLVRGILCRTCNAAIGLLKDDVNILESAIKYLKR
jgi:hypothetical protein